MQPRVFVGRSLPGPALGRLRESTDVEVWEAGEPPTAQQLAGRCRSVDGLLAMLTDTVDEDLLASCPKLRVVSNFAVGFDNLDIAALTRRGIPAGNTPGVLTDSTAELTMALILASARRLIEARDAVLAGEWRHWSPQFLLGRDLAGATLGIVGYGRIGEAVARRALAFDMRVLVTSRTPREAEGVEWVNLEELLRRSDIVSVHVNLAHATRQLIGVAELSLMRPGAVLVNTSRGEIVDPRALFEALASGHLAGAGLDVTEPEPIPLDDPLLGLANCIVLPHIGSATLATRSKMADLAVENLLAGLAGRRLPHCVNPEVYGPDETPPPAAGATPLD